MINVLVRIPTPYSAVSFYRSTGPFQHLRSIMNITFSEPLSYNWTSLGYADVVFLERPHTDNDLALVKLAKNLKRPVIVDYDDDLFSVPDWNPSFSQYGLKAKENIKEILSLADAVTVTTEKLADVLNSYRGLRKPCDIIPNAFPNHLITFKTPQKPPRQKIITWRGSSTHLKDLRIAYDGLRTFFERNPDWRIVFMGEPPYEAIERIGKYGSVIHSLEPIQYLNTLYSLAPAIHIVPLVDNEFNRSKSNIAYLEATFAGAAVLAPDWMEWQQPGCWNYPGSHDGFKSMLLAIGGDYYHSPGTANDHVAYNLTLDQVNLKRKALFESFV